MRNKRSKPKNGPSLPDELAGSLVPDERAAGFVPRTKSRKQLRQEARSAKKQKRVQAHAKSHHRASNVTSDGFAIPDAPPSRSKRKREPEPTSTAERIAPALKPHFVDEDPEDEEIRYLEAKLGISGSGDGASRNKRKLAKEFMQDGFDDSFVDFLDALNRPGGLADDKSDSSENEENRRLTAGVDSDSGSDSDAPQLEPPSESTSVFAEAKARREKKFSALYGQTASSASASGPPGAYVPPHLRNKAGASGDDAALKRRMRGLFNRLSEQNMEPIASELAGLFSSYPHATCMEALLACIDSICADTTQVLRPFVMVAAGVVSALHILVGAEIGAKIAEGVALRCQPLLDLQSDPLDLDMVLQDPSWQRGAMPSEGSDLDRAKVRNNMLLMLCYLYLFYVIDHNLVGDILKQLICRFTDTDVELLLLSLKHIGFQIRADDPALLRDLINAINIQSKRIGAVREDGRGFDVAGAAAAVEAAGGDNAGEDDSGVAGGGGGLSTRVVVMLEILHDLRNNRRRQSQQQLIERGSVTRKWLQRLGVKKHGETGATDTRMRFRWVDLMHIEDRGRWWVLGARWVGGVPGGVSRPEDRHTAEAQALGLEGGEDEKLLELARRMRMNTQVKRQIFVALMGAQDVDSAMERILKVPLKGNAKREIMRVLFECCHQEKQYNPFYAAVAQKLIAYAQEHKFTLQLCVWDFLKQCDESSTRAIYNIARMVAHLLLGFSLSLAMFKVVDFASLSAKLSLFMRACFEDVLLEEDETIVRAVFTRVGSGQDRSLVRDGVLVFLHRGMREHVKKQSASSRSRLKPHLQLARKMLEALEDDE